MIEEMFNVWGFLIHLVLTTPSTLALLQLYLIFSLPMAFLGVIHFTYYIFCSDCHVID